MVIAKGLIFKSLLGIATSGVVIVPIVLSKLSNKKTEEDSDVENGKSEEGSNGIISGSNQGVSDVSSSQITINTESQQTTSPGNGSNSERGIDISTNTPTQPEGVDTLGIPKSCSSTCKLTAEQLKNLKFEPKTTGASLTVEGLSGNSTVDLIVEDKKNDKDNYPKGKKYTLKVTGDKVTIGGLKDGDITIEKSKDVVIRETSSGGKLEKAPEEVDNLGIPKSCTTKAPCQLTKEQLQRFKFEQGGSSITIEGLSGNNKVELTVADVTNDKDNYPKNKKYTLKATSGDVTIKNTQDGNIILKKDKGVDFREKSTGGKLETVLDLLGIPKSCVTGTPCQLTQEQLKNVKFEPKGASSISVSGLGTNDKITLTITNVSNNNEYPKNKKYSFKTTSPKTATISGAKEDISITSTGIDFREKRDANVLEKVPVVKPQASTTNSFGLPTSCKVDQVKKGGTQQTCQLTVEDLKKVKFKDFDGKSGATTITGLTDPNNKIKLTISWDDDKDDYPDNKKYSFDNSSNNSDVKITKEKQEVTIAKKTESWFKNESGKLTLVKTKLEEEKENVMKNVNEELTIFGLTKFIKLEIGDFKKDDKVDFEQKTLKLDKDTMKLIQFSEFSGPPTDISDWNDGNKFDLKLDYAEDSNSYPKNMKFSFKNNSGKDITIKSAGKSLKFSNNKWETFKVVKNELTRTTTG